MRPLSLCLTLLLLAPLAGAAASVSVRGHLEFHDPPRLRGDVEVRDAGGGVLSLAEAVNASRAVRVHWARAEGYEVEVRWHGVQAGSAESVFFQDSDRRNNSIRLGAGSLGDLACLASCTVLLVPHGGGEVGLRGRVDDVLAHTRAPTTRFVAWPAPNQTDAFALHLAAGSLVARGGAGFNDETHVRDAEAYAKGRVLLVLWEVRGVARTDAGERPIETFTRTETVNGVAGVPVQVQNRTRFVVLSLEGARLEAPAGAPALLLSPAPTLQLAGSIESALATGWVEARGARHVVDGEHAYLSGVLRLDPRGVADALDAAPTTATTMEGEASVLTLGTVRVTTPLPASAGASGGAALLAMLLAVVAAAPRVLAIPLYSRIDRSRVLANENRKLVFEVVAGATGASIKDIATATGLSRIVVRHHLRFLEAHAFIRSAAKARGRLYYPPEVRPQPADVVLATSGETRRRILDTVASAPEALTQREIAQRTGVSVRLTSYHLKALEAGQIVRADAGLPKRYRVDPPETRRPSS